MRKILLGTTAVVGAALLGVSVAQAQTAPTVRVGGYFDFTGAYVDDSRETGDTDSIDFRTDTEISVIVRGKAANGLSYGSEIEIQVDGQGAGSTVMDLDELWGFVSSPTLGTLQFGDQDSAADQLKVSLPTVTGHGPSGIWDDLVASNQYLNSTINDGNDASKIIYLSPQFFGFDFGVSFAPNTYQGESQFSTGSNLQRQENQGNIRNEISGAIRYRGSFGNIGVAVAFSAMTGDAPSSAPSNFQDPNAYQIGVNVSGYGLTVGGHYLWGKYAAGSFGRTGLANGLENSTSANIGATYRIGAVSLGAFYAIGTADRGTNLSDSEQTVIGVGAVYTLAPGLELYANYHNVDSQWVQGIESRDINTFVIGSRLAF
ncbi:porin [Falsiroseomonas selenitidurans]|uniref:Porin n=1 Tax=Falsiroseomonas selenitidurans TaxID=2716335 RepID=A0ABX1ECH0_9PROT|nr:porin [Falsiroseomonas selenitidurans]NKC34573.1 porin [Falsiroseomonas selenitidurans]